MNFAGPSCGGVREWFGSGLVWPVEAGLGGEHLLVEDADDQNATAYHAVEHDMFSVLEPAQTHTHRIAGSSQSGSLSKHAKTFLYPGGIPRRLLRAPLKSGIANDAANIGARSV